MFIVCLVAAALATPFYSPHFKAYLQKQPNLRWEVGIPKRFANYTHDQVVDLFIHHTFLNPNIPFYYGGATDDDFQPPDDAPERLDYRETHPQCFFTPEDQASCSSCYAFATLGALTMRRCIAGVDSKAIPFSAQYLVSCDDRQLGCSGGQFNTTWEFLKTNGAVTRDCLPYTSGRSGLESACPTTCQDGTKLDKAKHYRAGDAEPLKNYKQVMESLINDGPVQTGFYVYEDFMYYVGGIYHKVKGASLGGHAVVIVGYGEMNGRNYWIVRNSWGPEWGEDGYFRIVRGKNECGIEKNAWKVAVK